MSQDRNPGADQQYRESDPRDDEISLVDLALVLYRRRWWILGVFILCVLGGIVYWQMQSPGTRYFSSLDIGTYVEGNNAHTIEQREQLATRLRESTLPRLRYELASEFEESITAIPSVSIRVPEEDQPGGYLFLSTEAGEEDEEKVRTLHERLIEVTLDFHQDRLDTYQERFETRLDEKRIELEELKDDRIVEHQRQNLKQNLEQAQDDLDQVVSQRDMLKTKWDNLIQEAEERITELKEQYEAQETQLSNRITEARERVERLEAEKKSLEVRLAEIEEERAFYREQEERLQVLMSSMRGLEQESLDDPELDPSLAMGMLIRGSYSMELQNQLRSIQEELRFGLMEKRLNLESNLEDIRLEIEEARREIRTREMEKTIKLAQLQREIQEAERTLSTRKEEKEEELAENERRKREAQRTVARAESELEKFEADHERKIQRKENEIRELKALEREFSPTEVSASVIPAETIGRGGSLILALSGVLGVMLGVFSAFFAEFTSKARERMRTPDSD